MNIERLLSAALIVLGTLVAPAAAAAGLAAAPDNGGITLPPGFKAVVVADGLNNIRGLTVSPDGDLYGVIRGSSVVALRDTTGDGVADVIHRIENPLDEARAPGSGIAWRDGYLYYSSNEGVYRYRMQAGELLPVGELETVVTGLPDLRQHAAKMFTFDGDGRLYVEVGAPSNALGNPDRARGARGLSEQEVAEFLSKHAGFWRFDPNRLNQTQDDGHHFSTGHRHMLSIAWHPVSRSLFGAQNGRDVLNVVDPENFSAEYNTERVAEEFHQIVEGGHYGWPYTFFDPVDNVRLLSPEYGGDGRKRPEPGRFPDPLIAFPAHWAPMQMAYYGHRNFPGKYHNGMFLAFRGSWNRAPLQRGYNICFIPFDEQGMPTGDYEVFADGFAGTDELRNPGDAAYRPMGVAVGPDGSLYVGGDQGGRVWRVFYDGE